MLLEIHKVNGVANEKADEAKRSGNHPWNFTLFWLKCDVLLEFGWKFYAKTLKNVTIKEEPSLKVYFSCHASAWK